MIFLRFLFENIRFMEFFKRKRGETLLLYELPSGNQVDGLPLAAIAKRKSKRPRTQVHSTMENMLFKCDCFRKWACEFNNKFKLGIEALDRDS